MAKLLPFREVQVQPCCGTRIWRQGTIASFFWSLRSEPICPSCGQLPKKKAEVPIGTEPVAINQ